MLLIRINCNKLILPLAYLFLIWGCEQEMLVDTSKSYSRQTALSGTINTDSSFMVMLSCVQPAYQSKYSQPKVKQASVLNMMTGETFILNPHPNDFFIELREPSIIPSPGETYKIMVKTTEPEQLLEAIDSIPYPAKLLSVDVFPVLDKIDYNGTLQFETGSNRPSFFEIALFIAEYWPGVENPGFWQNTVSSSNYFVTREDYYPKLLLIGSSPPPSLLFSIHDQVDTLSIDFSYTTSIEWNSLSQSTVPSHDIRVELRSVSKAYYLYKTSLYKQQYATEGDFLHGISPPVRVAGNIQGGYGVFCAYSKIDTIFRVEGRTGITR
jgi:hypothetical protein